jgi:hypothetical protein
VDDARCRSSCCRLGAIFAGFAFHGAFLEDAGFWNGAVAVERST